MGIDYDEALTLERSRTWRTDRRCHERRRQSCPVAVGWPVVDVVVAALRHLHKWQVHSSPRLLLLLLLLPRQQDSWRRLKLMVVAVALTVRWVHVVHCERKPEASLQGSKPMQGHARSNMNTCAPAMEHGDDDDGDDDVDGLDGTHLMLRQRSYHTCVGLRHLVIAPRYGSRAPRSMVTHRREAHSID